MLVFVPIAIARPRLSWLWALPLPLWLVREQSIYPPVWKKQHMGLNAALTPRVGHAPLIAYAVVVVASTLLVAGWRSASRDVER